MSLIDLESSNLDSMFYIDNEWICENDTSLSSSNKNNYNVIILNDRLMSETVQNEHSYFTSNHSSYGGQLAYAHADDSNDTHSFKEMDIESECFPCIPMSSAIQLSAASLIGNHHLSNSTLTSSPSSSISSINSINSLCNSSLSAATNSQLNNDAQFNSNNSNNVNQRRGRKGKGQSSNIIVTNCTNRQTKTDTKNSTLTALLNNCSPLISAASQTTKQTNSSSTQICLPPTPPSNSDSDCERDQTNDKTRDSLNKLSRTNQNDKQPVKRQRSNCSILVQSGKQVINLTQQLSPTSLKNLTSVNNNLDLNEQTLNTAGYLLNGNLKLDITSTNLINSNNQSSMTNRNRAGQSMSSLISVQPKNAVSGTIVQLTEEEKRTLIAEGYPIPTRFPLSKAEERSLKKIRRKIKNKISAQESRRKKKEYMEELERKVCLLDERVKQLESFNEKLENENEQLRKRIGSNDRTGVNRSSIKSNKSTNLELMNLKSIKIEPIDDEITIKDEFVCDEPTQQSLVVLTTDQSKFENDDYDDDDDDE